MGWRVCGCGGLEVRGADRGVLSVFFSTSWLLLANPRGKREREMDEWVRWDWLIREREIKWPEDGKWSLVSSRDSSTPLTSWLMDPSLVLNSDWDVSFRIQLDKSILLCLSVVLFGLVDGSPQFTENGSKYSLFLSADTLLYLATTPPLHLHPVLVSCELRPHWIMCDQTGHQILVSVSRFGLQWRLGICRATSFTANWAN